MEGKREIKFKLKEQRTSNLNMKKRFEFIILEKKIWDSKKWSGRRGEEKEFNL